MPSFILWHFAQDLKEGISIGHWMYYGERVWRTVTRLYHQRKGLKAIFAYILSSIRLVSERPGSAAFSDRFTVPIHIT